MELLTKDQIKEGNYYQMYIDNNPTCQLIALIGNEQLIINYWGFYKSITMTSTPIHEDFRFVIISKYSFERMKKLILNKLFNYGQAE